MNKNQKIITSLLDWYSTEKRDLPWRKTTDPYKIWVSEIMLQQTQVSRVIDYYNRFLKKFPNVGVLAEATWEEFLPYWRGLGFYSRGRNMLKTAQQIVQHHERYFPKEKKSLVALPGIGDYTASAIQSFAFHKAVPAIDTNLERIFQRIYGCTKKGVLPRAKTLFQKAAMMNSDAAPKLNHALMDLGSALCKSRRVYCEECPLQSVCHFFQSGKKEEWEQSLLTAPRKKIVSALPAMEVAVACIHHNGKYLICKRTDKKEGLWEFPGGKREKGESWRHCLQREIAEELGIEISVRPHFFESVWEDSQYLWRLRFSRCQILKGSPQAKEHAELCWVSPQELSEFSFPSANTKALQRLQKMRLPKTASK